MWCIFKNSIIVCSSQFRSYQFLKAEKIQRPGALCHLGMQRISSVDSSFGIVQLNGADVGDTAELTNPYQAFVPSFLRCEVLQKQLVHGIHQEFISPGENCCRGSRVCPAITPPLNLITYNHG